MSIDDEFAPDLIVENYNGILFSRGMPVLLHVQIFDDSPTETMSTIINDYPTSRIFTPPSKAKEIIVIDDDDDDEELNLAPRYTTPDTNQIVAKTKEVQTRGASLSSRLQRKGQAICCQEDQKAYKGHVAKLSRPLQSLLVRKTSSPDQCWWHLAIVTTALLLG